jgi:U3 small nucleolar RNA-associated protein 19
MSPRWRRLSVSSSRRGVSYTALLDGELNRELKKDPEVEFEIPKRIFTAEEGVGEMGALFGLVVEAR